MCVFVLFLLLNVYTIVCICVAIPLRSNYSCGSAYIYDEFRGIFRPIERVSKRYGMFVYIYMYFKECGNLDIVHRMLETKRAKV